MLKFIKYDIKGSLKTLLGFLFGGIIASIFVQINVNSKLLRAENFNYIKDVIAAVGVLVAAITVISFIVYAINSFNREINSDTGYLTFQTPEKMWKMVASKLIVMGAWSFIYIVVGIYFNILLSIIIEGGMTSTNFDYSEVISSEFFYILITDIIMTLSLIYLSLSISKTTIKYKKLNWIWIVILIVFIVAYSYIKSYIFSLRLSELLPGQVLLYYPLGVELKDGDQIYYMLMNLIFTIVNVSATGMILDKRINL